MDIIADIFLAAGAAGAGLYCFILGRRLKRFNDLEKGVGGAVAVLSAQVDDLTKTLSAAQSTAATCGAIPPATTPRARGCDGASVRDSRKLSNNRSGLGIAGRCVGGGLCLRLSC